MEHALAERLDTPLLQSAALTGALVLLCLCFVLCCCSSDIGNLGDEVRGAYHEHVSTRYAKMLGEEADLKEQAARDAAKRAQIAALKVRRRAADINATPAANGAGAPAGAPAVASSGYGRRGRRGSGDSQSSSLASYDRAPLLAGSGVLSHEQVADLRDLEASESLQGRPAAAAALLSDDVAELAEQQRLQLQLGQLQQQAPPPPPPPVLSSSWLSSFFPWGRRPSPRATPHTMAWDGPHGPPPPGTAAGAPPPSLPKPASDWKSATTPEGHEYWYNELSGESSWTRPDAAAPSGLVSARRAARSRSFGLFKRGGVPAAAYAPAPGDPGAPPLPQPQACGDASAMEMAAALGLSGPTALAGHGRVPAAARDLAKRSGTPGKQRSAESKRRGGGSGMAPAGAPGAAPRRTPAGSSSRRGERTSGAREDGEHSLPADSAGMPAIDVDALDRYYEYDEYGQPVPTGYYEAEDGMLTPLPMATLAPAAAAMAPQLGCVLTLLPAGDGASLAPAAAPGLAAAPAGSSSSRGVPPPPSGPPPQPQPTHDEYGNPLPAYKYSFATIRQPLRRNVLLRAKRPVVHVEIPEELWADEDEAELLGAPHDPLAMHWEAKQLASTLPDGTAASLPKPNAPGTELPESPMVGDKGAGAAAGAAKMAVDMVAAGLGTSGGTPSLNKRPTLTGGALAQAMGSMESGQPRSPDSPGSPRGSPDGANLSPGARARMGGGGPLPTVYKSEEERKRELLKGRKSSKFRGAPGLPRGFDLGPESDEDEKEGEGEEADKDEEGNDAKADAGSKAANLPTGASFKTPLEMRTQQQKDRDASDGPSPLGSPGGHAPGCGGSQYVWSGAANAGCAPGMDSGTGEGLSALFVHPDEDVYDLSEGGGILAEPPRTFEALAFAPRVAGHPAGRRRRIVHAPVTESAADADEDEEDAGILGMFASAAALGGHRTPPRVIRRTTGMGGHSEFSWQMWASENLTDAIGVPAEEAPAEAPAADEATAKTRRDKEKAKAGAKGAKGADSAEAATATPSTTEGIRTAAELHEETKKMHIDYVTVLRSHAEAAEGAKAEGAAAEAGAAADAKADAKGGLDSKRPAAAGLSAKADKPAKGGGKPKGKGK